MTLEIIDFGAEHCEQAAALVAARCRALQATVPELPPRACEPETYLPMIQDLAAKVPGVAALRGGRLVGFLMGFVLPDWRGQRGAYSPEWANGADLDAAAQIYPLLYAKIAPRWLANGCHLHAMSVVASDRSGVDSLYWQGFGLHVVDGMRGLEPIGAQVLAENIIIRQAKAEDLGDVAVLGEGLQRHLAAPPIYLALAHRDGPEEYAEWLAVARNAKWIAYRDGEAVAEMGFEPSTPHACTIMRDEGTMSIVSAFTRPTARGHGVGAALLERGLAAARAAGYVRCAVDFESANIEGARFWMRYFQPICYSVVRVIDPRMGRAGADREAQSFW